MRNIAYLLFILSIGLGFMAVYPIVVLPLALATSFIFIASRRQWLKDNPPAVPVNPFVDGIYLFAVHVLIHFSAFAIGFFLNHSVGFR